MVWFDPEMAWFAAASGKAGHPERFSAAAIQFRLSLKVLFGLAETWGKSVFNCPYCHGYGLDQGRIGVIATGPMSLHQAQLLPEWGEMTFLSNGCLALDAALRDDLRRCGVGIEEAPVSGLIGHADVQLCDGRIPPASSGSIRTTGGGTSTGRPAIFS